MRYDGAMRDKKQKFAVFDIDGTIFRSSLLIELVEALIQEGYFPASARKNYEIELNLWQDRKGSYDDYIRKVIETYVSHVKGLPLGEVIEVAERALLFKKNRVYRYTRDLVEKLQKDHFMLAVSHSPYHIVEPFARAMGFNKVYAFLYEIDDDGFLTGNVQYQDLILRKDLILQRAIEKENLTLAGSVGVGDTDSDAPMLKMVKRPIAFNPNSGLYKIAKRNRWEIVVERKDVIYKI